VYSELQSIWKDSGITIDVKLQLLMTIIFFPVLLYAAETWTVNKEDEKRLPALEMRLQTYFGSEMGRSKN